MNKDKFLFLQKYNWEDHAKEIFQSWIPDIIQTVDEMQKFVLKNSTHLFNNDGLFPDEELVDSMSIRNILFLYILRIFGVDNSDEFEYKIVNMIFPVNFKIYIKKIACYP
jgi:hypothetical protein